jgi:hypothetical protein
MSPSCGSCTVGWTPGTDAVGHTGATAATLYARAESLTRGNFDMKRLSRRQVLGGAAAAAAAVTLGAPSVCAQKGRQTLRFVVEADLKVFDPVWTTAYITRNHGYLVYDTLFGTDENLRIKPQMVKYTFLLRDGLRWHDGPPVHSERLRGVAEALGKAGSVRAAAHGPHGENRTS